MQITNKDLRTLFNEQQIEDDLKAILDCSEEEALEAITYKFDSIVDVDDEDINSITIVIDLVFVYKNYELVCDKLISLYPSSLQKLTKVLSLVFKLTNMAAIAKMIKENTED